MLTWRGVGGSLGVKFGDAMLAVEWFIGDVNQYKR